MLYDCLIIGAGASGLFCAASFNKKINGLILEKTSRAGTKLLMSGSGHCNITHSGSVKDFIKCYGDNGSLIRKCLYKYSNLTLMNFLAENGIAVTSLEDGRVFPSTMCSQDILNMLLKRTRCNGFKISYKNNVLKIKRVQEGFEIHTQKSIFYTKNLIVASGGASYPATGSDAAMFDVLKRDLNLNIIEPKPALTPIKTVNYHYGDLAGISFNDVNVSIWRNGCRLIDMTGGLLFTHDCLSGPAILNISKYARSKDIIKINYVHPLKYEDIFTLLKEINRNDLLNFLITRFSLPKRFLKKVAEECNFSYKKISKRLSEDTLEIEKVAGFEKAMVTSGGVDLGSIDTASMQLKDDSGVFIIGEVLDIDGITGGYNLQFAYSSAKAAAEKVCQLI